MLLAVGVVLCLVAEAAIVFALVVLAACWVWRRLGKLAQAQRYTPEQMAAAREVVERWKTAQAKVEAEKAQRGGHGAMSPYTDTTTSAEPPAMAIKGACSCGHQIPGDGWSHTWFGCSSPAMPRRES